MTGGCSSRFRTFSACKDGAYLRHYSARPEEILPVWAKFFALTGKSWTPLTRGQRLVRRCDCIRAALRDCEAMRQIIAFRSSRVTLESMADPKPLPPDIWAGPPAGRLRDMPEPERSQFGRWLRGQTVPSLAGVRDSDQDAFYLHDYRTWRDGRAARTLAPSAPSE